MTADSASGAAAEQTLQYPSQPALGAAIFATIEQQVQVAQDHGRTVPMFLEPADLALLQENERIALVDRIVKMDQSIERLLAEDEASRLARLYVPGLRLLVVTEKLLASRVA